MSRIAVASASTEFSDLLRSAIGDLGGDTIAVWPSGLGTGDPEGTLDELMSGRPELVLLGPGVDLDAAFSVAERLDIEHPDTAVLIVAEPTPDVLERALLAGTRGVLAPTAHPSDISSAVERALAVSRRRREVVGDHSTRLTPNRIVPVLAAKGGSGKTTVATNLAASLAQRHPGDVVLVDIDLQFGDVAAVFGTEAEHTFADLGKLKGPLDSTTLKAYLTPKQSAGLYLLAGPDSPAQADELQPARVAEAVKMLAAEFPYVVVDTAAGIDEFTLEVLDLATDLVLLTSMDVPSVRAAAKEIDALELLGMTDRPWHFVLNRATAKVGLSVDDIEATLGREVDVRIPSTRQIPLSVNRGEPLALRDGRSAPGRAFDELAKRISGGETSDDAWWTRRRKTHAIG